MKKNSIKWQQTKLPHQEAESMLTQAGAASSIHIQGYIREVGGRLNHLTLGFNTPGDLTFFTFGASGFLASIDLYNPATGKLYQAAEKNLDASKALSGSYQAELTFYVLMQYLLAQKYQKKIDVSERNLKKSLEIQNLAIAKVRSGVGINLDLIRAKGLVEYEKLRLQESKSLLLKAKQDLASLLGLKKIDQPVDALMFKELPKDIIEPKEAKNNRLDLKASLLGVDAAEHFKNQYNVWLSPKFSFFADVGVVGTHVVGGFGNALNGSVGIQLELSIFDGHYRDGKYNEALTKQNKYLYQARQIELDIDTQIPVIIEQLKLARNAIDVATLQIDSVTKELQIVSQRYKTGASSSLEIVNAKSSFAMALETQLEALFAYEASKLNYFRTIGKIDKYLELQ